MSNISLLLLDGECTKFEFFDEVYLFGSCLRSETPVDIDLLLVYREGQVLWDVRRETQRTLDALCSTFEGTIFDLTVMSTAEVEESAILEKVQYARIKGRTPECSALPKPT